MFSMFKKKPVLPAPVGCSSHGSDSHIDVKKLIASIDIQSHLLRAEGYFQGMSVANGEFRKPFMGSEAVQLVPLLGVMLSHLEFYGGMRVLDFGCGTGWLSQSLALMGAEVIAVDASQSVLRLAEENTHARYPELKGKIQYVVFDGEHLDIKSGEIDRIVCMDSFHHVPNPEAILAEFGRVLANDGRAVFSEPGEAHSRSAESQHAMRTFGVIENDIILAEIWRMAQRAGFEQLRVAAYATPPLLSLEEFDSLRAPRKARPTMRKLYNEAYSSLNSGGRQFVLMKKQQARDSRFREGLTCHLSLSSHSDGPILHFDIIAKNTGTTIWRPSGEAVGSVNAGLITRSSGGVWDYEFGRHHFLFLQLLPGEEVAFSVMVSRSDLDGHELYVDLVAEQVTWFGQNGNAPLRLH